MVCVLIAATARGQQLRFAPPPLSSPTILTVSAGGTDRQQFTLNDDEDAILQFPNQTIYHPVQVDGGRNVVVMGGSIVYSGCYTRALSFSRMPAGSVVFIEGMTIDVSNAPGADAINANGATNTSPDVYLQNSRIVGVHGTAAGHHGDGFQFDGTTSGNCIAGRGHLYVGNCDIETSYQGLIVAKHTYHDPSFTFVNRVENCYFNYNNITSDPRCAYIYWTSSGASPYTLCNYLDMQNVWMNERTPWSMTIKDDHLFPGPTYNVDYGSYVVSTHPYVSGRVEKGIPAGGTKIIGSSQPGAGYANVTGYKELVGDYSYESENTVNTTSNGTWSMQSDANASEGGYVRFNPSSTTSSFIKFAIVPVPDGTRTVTVRYLAGPDGGTASFTFGGSYSTTIDMYAATPTWKTHTHSTTLSYTIGKKYPVFTLTGKNASSSGYVLRIDRIRFSEN